MLDVTTTRRCDPASRLKVHMRAYLNSGHDIERAGQMYDAMKSSGGIPSLSATLCDCDCSNWPLQDQRGELLFAHRVYYRRPPSLKGPLVCLLAERKVLQKTFVDTPRYSGILTAENTNWFSNAKCCLTHWNQS